MPYSPEQCCPICGVPNGRHGGGCNPKTLASIDAARKRDDDTIATRKQTYYQRLYDGFNLLRKGGWELTDQ